MQRRQKTKDVVNRAREHDWKVALPAGVVTVAALVVGSSLGDVHGPHIRPRIVVWCATAVLVVCGTIATRRFASGLGLLVSSRTIPASGAAVRLIATVVGYLFVVCAVLGLLDVPLDHLLIGAGLAGIVLGIAAQQSLGNVFASLVLLLSKPFVVGERIRIRSGALGGIFDATVVELSLTYVTVRTDDGILRIPNSVMLAAASGPVRADAPPPSTPAPVTAPRTAPGGEPTNEETRG